MALFSRRVQQLLNLCFYTTIIQALFNYYFPPEKLPLRRGYMLVVYSTSLLVSIYIYIYREREREIHIDVIVYIELTTCVNVLHLMFYHILLKHRSCLYNVPCLIYTYIDTHVYTYVYICIYTCVYMYYVYIYIYVYMCIHMYYVYVYIYI